MMTKPDIEAVRDDLYVLVKNMGKVATNSVPPWIVTSLQAATP